MSSYICSAKHFASIEHNLINFIQSKDFNHYEFSKKLNEQDIKDFVNNLKELNVICVTLQYKDHYEGKIDAEISEQREILKEKTTPKDLSLLGLYNALCCVNYQIETEHGEGIIDKLINETIPILDKFINMIARVIVSNLPEDKTNRWEIN